MSAEVCAITVAYNNPRELARLLVSLETHHDLLHGLVIIDNSDDSYVMQNKDVFTRYSSAYAFAQYLKTEENIGSAGGFHDGMEIAHEKDFDWVWLLDQDGTVGAGCLQALLARTQEGEILCPNIADIDQPRMYAAKVYANNSLGGWYPASWCSTNCRIQTFGTHGALISRKALDTIGYYDDVFFFVGWEDYDYGYRATAAGLNIVFVKEASALHPCSRSHNPPNRRWAPVHLEYVRTPGDPTTTCRKTRELAPFSQAYLESRHLHSWQFGAALLYSSLFACYHKATRARTVSLTATLRLFVKCIAHNVKQRWPYDSIEHLCRDILA